MNEKIRRIRDRYESGFITESTRNTMMLEAIEQELEEEHYFTESFFKTIRDIKYNEDKLKRGEVNLCFVIGYSGGGKSTLSQGFTNSTIIDMDKVVMGFDKPKEYFSNLPKICQDFVNGPGKKYMMFAGAPKPKSFLDYDENITKDFIDFIINYANSHKSERFIAEGVWTFQFCEPQDFTRFAVFIKGTSALKAASWASKRGSNQATGKETKLDNLKYSFGRYTANAGLGLTRKLEKWQKYYGKLVNKEEKEKVKDEKADKKILAAVKHASPSEIKKLKNCCEKLKADKSSAEYKKAHGEILKFFGKNSTAEVINVTFGDQSANLRYYDK